MQKLMPRIGKVGIFAPTGLYSALQSAGGARLPWGLVQEACSSSYPCKSSLPGAKTGFRSLLLKQFDANFCLANKTYTFVCCHSGRMVSSRRQNELATFFGGKRNPLGSLRTLASGLASESSVQNAHERKQKDITTVEDPFDAPTYNIPEKPVNIHGECVIWCCNPCRLRDTKVLARLWNGFKMIRRSVLELGLQSKDMVNKVEIEPQDNEFLIEPGLMRMAWNMWRYTSNGRENISIVHKDGSWFLETLEGQLSQGFINQVLENRICDG